MIEQGFHIGERDWWVMVYYDIQSERELNDAYRALLASGCERDEAQEACMVLGGTNGGYTFTNFDGHVTLMFIGKADSAEEFYDTCQHEVKHAVEHISEYYEVNPKGEPAAYLQGEIGRQLFPIIIQRFCRK